MMLCAVQGDPVNTVDIFNARSGIWTTAALSVARYWLAATSLPNDGLAIFAGGQSTSAQQVLKSLIAEGVVCGSGWGKDACESRSLVELPPLIADALRRFDSCCQCCGHLQCYEWDMDHCCSQRRSILSCSHIAAE